MAAQEEQFEAMIAALGTLKQEILEACETMRTASETCASEMDADDLSAPAQEKVEALEVGLRNKTSDITALQRELSSKLEQLRELKRKAQQMGN